jgi:hypothetical protein
MNLCTVDAVLRVLVSADEQFSPFFSAQAALLFPVCTPGSAYMNDGALGAVFDGTAQDFVGEWGGIALAEKDEAQDVDNGANVGPVKVDVGNTSGGLLQVNQQGSDGIGNDGASGAENAIGAFAHSLDTNMFGEFGSVSALYLDEVDGVVVQ